MLTGKNAIITGSNRGIGRAIVEKFAQNGANIWACCRKKNEEFESDMAELAKKNGVWIKPVYFDLDTEESIKEGLQSIFDEKLPINILVNNAGVTAEGLLNQVSIDSIRKVFDINFFSQLVMIQRVSKKMIRNRGGVIINLASIAGMMPLPGRTAYGGSKAAVIWMTQSQARELAPFHIRVNAMAPGTIDTDMIKHYSEDQISQFAADACERRIGTAEEVAKVALFLASDQSSFVNGQIIRVDGGR